MFNNNTHVPIVIDIMYANSFYIFCPLKKKVYNNLTANYNISNINMDTTTDN